MAQSRPSLPPDGNLQSTTGFPTRANAGRDEDHRQRVARRPVDRRGALAGPRRRLETRVNRLSPVRPIVQCQIGFKQVFLGAAAGGQQPMGQRELYWPAPAGRFRRTNDIFVRAGPVAQKPAKAVQKAGRFPRTNGWPPAMTCSNSPDWPWRCQTTASIDGPSARSRLASKAAAPSRPRPLAAEKVAASHSQEPSKAEQKIVLTAAKPANPS